MVPPWRNEETTEKKKTEEEWCGSGRYVEEEGKTKWKGEKRETKVGWHVDVEKKRERERREVEWKREKRERKKNYQMSSRSAFSYLCISCPICFELCRAAELPLCSFSLSSSLIESQHHLHSR